MLRALAAILLFTTILATVPSSARAIEVHGHRAARASFPESSLSAWQYALEIGVDYIEGDLRVTRDGVVVLHHDEYLSPVRCLDGKGHPLPEPILISSLTLAELKSYDCGSLGDPRFPKQAKVPGSRIATLEEALALVASSQLPAARTVGFYLELKTGHVPSAKVFSEKVAQVIEASGLRSRFIMTSFLPTYERAAKRALARHGVELRTHVVSPPSRWLSRPLVKMMHTLGYSVIPWTPNSVDEWMSLIAMGVDGIITDDPAGLIEYTRHGNARAD